MTAGQHLEDLQVGMEASLSRIVSDRDIMQFAEISGDDNPVHVDEVYAAGTMFKGRIAHGILTASYISAVIGTKLPGPGCIYVSQTLNFKAPVRIGDQVETSVRIAELLPEKKRVILACRCSVNGKTVLEGQAVVIVPSRQA
ncbi:MAG: MaoC family dehydratase [Hyphomicrobiales bacterium]|nr:MaoC family dehydratase [Hyphomicrobiales bacterium]